MGPYQPDFQQPVSEQNSPQPQPGYPIFGQGGYGTYQPQPQPQQQQPQYYYPAQGGGYYTMIPPPQLSQKPQRSAYRLTLGIISVIALALLLIGGLFSVLIGGIDVLLGSPLGSAAALVVLLVIAALGGGGVGLYFAIRAIANKSSAAARFPPFYIFAALTAAVFITEFAIKLTSLPPSGMFSSFLIVLSGVLPALTILAFTINRLGNPTTWRRLWMSLLSGMFLATLIAIILELTASAVIAIWFANGPGALNSNILNSNSSVLYTLLIISVVAPLVEEGFKPSGPLILIGRIRSPAEAFALGLASGIGFNIFETIGYISSGQADWIQVAFERIGAGLLHGVGAGMATLGWYYIFRGKGVRLRALKGIGAIIYAILQHALFNGSNLLNLVPGPIGNALNYPLYFLGMYETTQIFLFFAIYILIALMLIKMTGALRLKPTEKTSENAQISTASGVLTRNT